jgi:hypothetical protein
MSNLVLLHKGNIKESSRKRFGVGYGAIPYYFASRVPYKEDVKQYNFMEDMLSFVAKVYMFLALV